MFKKKKNNLIFNLILKTMHNEKKKKNANLSTAYKGKLTHGELRGVFYLLAVHLFANLACNARQIRCV